MNLITGSTTPRTGEVRAFGRATTEIPDSDTWLEALRAYGLLGVRTVLIDQLTVEQNLAIPLTLEVDPLPDALQAQMRELGEEVGLAASLLEQRPAGAGRRWICSACASGARWRSSRGCCSPSTRRRRSSAPTPTQLARDMSRIVARARNGRGVHHRRPRVRAAGR